MNIIRTRFAPSPTGYLHLGGIRTALFAWLFARQNNGQFILRIEDTDKQREVSGSIQHIIESLQALGLEYDEGPDIGGPHGPYIQSDRLSIYHEWATKLVAKGLAYNDPYTKEELEALRQTDIANKKPFLFRNHRKLTSKEWDKTKALRFKSNPKDYHWNDAVMGELSSKKDAIDDFIIIKEDGFPTYNFAHIVDDHLMGITHIFRSHEFLASLPKYLNLYEAFDITPPVFVTVPPILGPGGTKKLSKRDNAKDVLDYIKDGYLVDALITFMASLGWNDGTEQEIYQIDELITKFSLDHIQKSPAQYDEKKLDWLNSLYLRNLKLSELDSKLKSYWPPEALQAKTEYRLKVLGITRDRLKTLTDISDLVNYFFTEPPIDNTLISSNPRLSNLPKSKLLELLKASNDTLSNSDFTINDLTERLNKLLIELNQKPVILFSIIRIATTQSPFSPGLFETLNVLGKDKTITRINNQIQYLKS